MKVDLSFKSSARIEHLLAQLVKAVEQIQDAEQGVSDIIFGAPDKYEPLLNAIFRNQYIAEHYDLDTIISLLQHSYYTSKPKSGTEYLAAFKDIFQKVRNEWLCIIPLDYNGPFAKQKTFRPLKFGKYMLTQSQREKKRLLGFLRSNFDLAIPDESLLDHQVLQTGGFLYSRPLLVFALHGSRRSTEEASRGDLRLFTQLHSLYTANFGQRSTLITFHQQLNPVNHGFLLDRKDGEVYRFPLRESSRLLTRLNTTQLRKFIEKDFARLLGLMSENTAGAKLKNRMLRALHFFSKGFYELDRLSRFLFYVIAAEALFSRDRDTPISATLADYTSLMSSSKQERLAVHKRMRRIYALRSSIVHSGETTVSNEDVDDTQLIVARTLLKSVRSLLPATAIRSEDEFFEELRKLKLRLASRLRARRT